MARIRSINPAANHDEDVATMSRDARLLWAYLPCYADREGRLKDSPFQLKHEIMPTDAVDMNALLDELAAHRHIIRYLGSDGRKYIQIRSFAKYQNPHKHETPSKIPGPGEPEAEATATDVVYFAQEGDDGPIKIGRSSNVISRLMSIQTGCSKKVRLLGVTANGSREMDFHKEFSHLRIVGEWFTAAPDLLDRIHSETARELPGEAQSLPANDGSRPAIPDPIPIPSPSPVNRAVQETAALTLSVMEPKPSRHRKARVEREYPPLFLVFWDACVSRESKATALDAWNEFGLEGRPDRAAVVTAAMIAQRPKFQRMVADRLTPPYAASWLRAERWNDPAGPTAKAIGPPPREDPDVAANRQRWAGR